jgi:hypothetical protein
MIALCKEAQCHDCVLEVGESQELGRKIGSHSA